MFGDKNEIVQAVRADVEAGLSDLLHIERFETVGPFAEAGALVDARHAVVCWSLVGIDCKTGFNGMWPTAKRIEVKGISVVDASEEPWTFSRHVDWNHVNSQLGGSRGRTSAPFTVRCIEDALFYAADRYGIDVSLPNEVGQVTTSG